MEKALYMDKVKETLEMYDECYVEYSNGAYRVKTTITISAHTPHDYKYIGTFKAEDVFTEDEMIINYVKSFSAYPVRYHGAKDYQAVKNITDETTVAMVNGNIVFS